MTILKGKLNASQRRRLISLLDMMYQPQELADEVGFTRRQIYRVYLKLGCPHQRNENGHIFINGKAFREWYLSTFKKAEMKSDESFCLSCKKPVKIVNPKTEQRADITYLVSNCPNCGRRLTRIISNRRKKDGH